MAARAPGIYKAKEEARFVPMQLGPVGVPGFVGVAERGPVNEPVRLTTFESFQAVYGSLEADGYLSDAVKGFFDNGGDVCYVLRVAHLVRRGREDTARPAFLRVNGKAGKPTLTIAAANHGEWGNRIRVVIKNQKPRVSTFLTLDLREGDTSAVIKSTHGLARGTVVRIRDNRGETYRTIVDLSGKTITWASDEPLERDFKSGAPTFIEPVEFTVATRIGTVRESFRDLSMSPVSDKYFAKVINNNSALIRVEDQRLNVAMPENYPGDLEETPLALGADGLYTITPEDFIGANIGPGERFGLAAYEANEEVDLLVIPDLMWALHKSAGFRTEKDVEVVQQAMVSQCERMKTRFAILDVPDPVDHRRAGQWRLLFDTAFAAFYYPWVEVETPGGHRLVPPSGHIAGIYSRCDQGEGPYRAPANEDIKGIFNVARDLREADIGQLNSEGINCLKPFPRRGIRVWGARTASSDPSWRYVPVRRVVNAVISSVERGLQWSVFEVNSTLLWKSVTRQITNYLTDLWQAGYFTGRTPEEAFFVKCDHETNTRETIDAGMVIVDCGVAPVRPAEFMIFRVATEMQELGPGG